MLLECLDKLGQELGRVRLDEFLAELAGDGVEALGVQGSASLRPTAAGAVASCRALAAR